MCVSTLTKLKKYSQVFIPYSYYLYILINMLLFIYITCHMLAFFQYTDLQTQLADPTQLRSKPDVSELKFGQIFTDHMLKIFYHKKLGGWQKPEIIPFENISLHPAAKVLHYAIEVSIK